MKIYQCLIVDDTLSSTISLKESLSQLPFFTEPQVCSRIEEATALIHQNSFDLIFLDVKLPDPAGMVLLKTVTRHTPVIISTDDDGFAVDCYDLDVADYLLKPYDFARFTRAINRALNVKFMTNHFAGPEGIYLKLGRNIQRFAYNDINYIEAYASYCKIYTANKVDVVTDSISNLEASLPKNWFVRVHKSFIINVSKITGYGHRHVEIGAANVPLGAVYRNRFQGFLNLLNKPIV